MNKISIQDIVQIITGVSVIIGLLGGVIAWMHTVYKQACGVLNTLKVIEKEFSTNGGSSLRDSINLISENQSKILSLKRTLYCFLDREYSTPLLIADRSGRCLWANKAYLLLTNKSLNDILDSNWETTVHIEDRDYVKEEWYNSCESGRSFEIIYRLNNINNTNEHVKCTVYGDTHSGYVAFLEKIEFSKKVIKNFASPKYNNL